MCANVDGSLKISDFFGSCQSCARNTYTGFELAKLLVSKLVHCTLQVTLAFPAKHSLKL